MPEILTASEVWLDSLRPIQNADGLQDVVAVINIRYVNEAGDTVIITNKSQSTFDMMTPEQLGMVQGIYQSMIDGFKAQYLPQPTPDPTPEPEPTP